MRFREELRAGREPDQAADAAMATSGLAVVLSGPDRHRVGHRHLPDQHPGAAVDGDRRDPRGRRRRAHLDDADPRGAGDVRHARRRNGRRLLHWSRRPETTQSRFWTRWIGWVMRRPWVSALGAAVLLLALAAPAFSMMLGNSMQRQFDPTHEIRGGVNAAAEALGPGALGPVRVLVTFPDGNAASAPTKEPLPAGTCSRRCRRRPTSSRCRPPVFGNDNRSALAVGGAVGGSRGHGRPRDRRLDAGRTAAGGRRHARRSTSAARPR